MKTMPAGLLVLALSATLNAAPAAASATPTVGAIERAEAKEASSLLAEAVAYLQKHGSDKSFKAFNDPKGGFVHGAKYVYIVGSNGIMYANGGAPDALVGADVSDLHDAAGKPFVRELLDAARENSAGVVEYRWLNRTNNRIESKTASFLKVGKYIVCVGYYIPRSAPEEAQALLEKAVAQVQQAGAAPAYRRFADPKGMFVRGDLYVFAIGIDDGKYRVSGAAPSLSGTDARDLRDAVGKPLVQEMIVLAKEKGSGTVDYVWRNPATNAVESKHAMIRRVGDVLVGVGYYSK